MVLTAIVARRGADPCLNTEIAQLERDLATTLAAPKSGLLQTLPRVANVSLAQLIAEVGPLLERCDNPSRSRDVRCCTSDACVRQVTHGRVPLRSEQAGAGGDHRVRGQLAALVSVGW